MNEFLSSSHGKSDPYQEDAPLLIPIIDGLIIFCSLFFSGFLYWQFFDKLFLDKMRIWLDIWYSEYLQVAVFALGLFFLFTIVLNTYKSGTSMRRRIYLYPFLTPWAGTVFLLLLVSVGTQSADNFSRKIVMAWFVAVPVLMALWRLLYGLVLYPKIYHKLKRIRTALLGDHESINDIARYLEETPYLATELIGNYDDRLPGNVRKGKLDFPYIGSFSQCIQDAHDNKFDLVYICMPLFAQDRVDGLIKSFSDTTVSVSYIFPTELFINVLRPTLQSISGHYAVGVFESPHTGLNSDVKRMEDIVLGSIILLLITLPMIVIAALIKVTSPGPILFKQHRYGLSGKEFVMYKFRSMTTADDGDEIKQAVRHDTRVTALGKFLRKTSLDELPQFINVLKGEMSIVGPRPHAVAHNEEFRKLIPGYMLRHKVKPGITGLAQVMGFRGETDTCDKMEGRVRYDLEYIQNWNVRLDLKIIFLTLFKGFVGKDVY